ncbi:MAG: M1 family metallopeptidase [Ferruginibacter sp.]|nr:M1 family metallopeptidase [Cytophagales bacterium]
MKKTLVFFLASMLPVVLAREPSRPLPAGDPYPRNAHLDVLHYRFQLTLNDENDQISGEATVEVRFRAASVSEFELDLVDRGADGKGMTVESVTSEEKAIPFVHQNDRLRLQLPVPAQPEQKRAFRIAYRGIPEDGLIISANQHGDRTFFGDNWPNRARHWLPTVDHPADKATCEFVVIAPNHYQVIANGAKVQETDLPALTRRTHWKESVSIPTKVMVIGVARFAVQQVGEVNGKPVQSWVYPQDREAGFHDYALALPILRFMEQRIGPYAYEKLANVQSKTRYGGMENASNIFYDEKTVTGKRDSEDLLAHEIAHQWFGDSASELDWHHVWLSEGFATYLTQVYREATYGRERLVQGMTEARSKVLAYYQNTPDAPIVDTTVTDLNQLLNPNSYQKGAWVLHMLRHAVGEESFWKGIRGYYQQYRDGNALTADFQRVMEEASGKDLAFFFQQWLFRAGQPVLEGTWQYDTAGKKLLVRLKQIPRNGFLFRFPLEIGVYNAAGKRVKTTTLEVDQTEHTFRIPLANAPDAVKLDPDTWLLIQGALTRK